MEFDFFGKDIVCTSHADRSLPNSKLLSLPLQENTLFKMLTSETADNFRKCETKVDSNKPTLVEAYSKGFRPRVEFVLLLCSTMEFRLLKCLHCLTKKNQSLCLNYINN